MWLHRPRLDGSKMPRLVLPLSDLLIKSAKPREKSYKLSDGGGLYLEVTPVGTKLWRMSYTQANGKKNLLAAPAESPIIRRVRIALGVPNLARITTPRSSPSTRSTLFSS
jgi:hypothetical protein